MNHKTPGETDVDYALMLVLIVVLVIGILSSMK